MLPSMNLEMASSCCSERGDPIKVSNWAVLIYSIKCENNITYHLQKYVPISFFIRNMLFIEVNYE